MMNEKSTIGTRASQTEAAIEESLEPQLRFLKMNRAERAKAFRGESKAMARFYADHPEEVLPDFYDEPSPKSNRR